MGFKPITVNTEAADPAHILAQDDANLYNGLFGADCILNTGSKLSASIISNNLVRLSDGAIVIQGHLGRIPYGEYEDVVIENGAAGKLRNDLIVARFQTVGGIDRFEIVVLKGTPGASATDPETIVGDLEAGANLREYPLYRVKLNGLSITDVVPLFSVVDTLKDFMSHKADKDPHTIYAKKQQDNWTNLSLFNGWVNSNGYVARYRKDEFSVVHVKGFISSGTINQFTVIATLPVGYRPTETKEIIAMCWNGSTGFLITRLYIMPDGNIKIIDNASNGWMILDFSFETF